MMKQKYLAIALLVASSFTASAAVSVIHEYHLGEPGSLSGAGNLPIDSVGSADFVAENNGELAQIRMAGVSAPGSTHYINTDNLTTGTGTGITRGGWFNADYSSLATDNFAFGVYARAASNSDTTNQGVIFTTGNGAGAYDVSLAANGWAASANNVSWIGGTSGVVGSFTDNTWVHLALIRKSGSTQFYINGVAQGDAYNPAPVQGLGHLGVNPGGAARFNGDIDEVRIVTFDASDSDAAILSVPGRAH